VAELVRRLALGPYDLPYDDDLVGLLTAYSSSSIVTSNLNEIPQRGEVWLVDLGMAAKLRPDRARGSRGGPRLRKPHRRARAIRVPRFTPIYIGTRHRTD
jgi:hypothetical protein